MFSSDHDLATNRPGPETNVRGHPTRVASGPQITKPPIRKKKDNLYEKRTNPLARLFTTLRSSESSKVFSFIVD